MDPTLTYEDQDQKVSIALKRPFTPGITARELFEEFFKPLLFAAGYCSETIQNLCHDTHRIEANRG